MGGVLQSYLISTGEIVFGSNRIAVSWDGRRVGAMGMGTCRAVTSVTVRRCKVLRTMYSVTQDGRLNVARALMSNVLLILPSISCGGGVGRRYGVGGVSPTARPSEGL